MYIVFVSTEIDPILPGGAGTVVAETARLLQAAGHRVEVLLVADPPEPIPDFDIPVTWIEPGVRDRDAPDQHRANSRAAAEALTRLEEQPDLVEFQDFHGLGLWALMRRGVMGLSRMPIVVRAHGPIDLVFDRLGLPTGYQAVARSMEREAYRMADAVIVPSRAVAELIATHYDLEPERIRIGELPVPAVGAAVHAPAPAPEVVYYGRLAEEKGPEDLLQAMMPIMEEESSATLRFIGPDGWRLKSGKSMTAHLRSLIPSHLAGRVRFEPAVDRHHLAEALSTAWIAVFPTRFETFCLAAHECRQLGLPIVVPQLPEFGGFFGYRSGARVYDGTVAGLRTALAELIARPDVLAEMGAAPLPAYGNPLAPYRPLAPRHPRTQAGLATAALRRVEAAARPAEPSRPAASQLADRILDGLPEFAASKLERRGPAHPALRRWRRRRAAGAWEREQMADMWDGSYPELTQPIVSIVIPCFNQGAFLHDAIRSVFRQAFPSWEILVVDDGSTDPHTRAVLRSLHYPRTRIIRQRNQGLPAARNAGMRAARGRYLVPLDADDEITPAFLTETVDALDRHPAAAYAHTWTRLFGNQNLVWIDRPFNPYQLLLSTSVVGCALIRAEAWRRVGGYDTGRRQGNEDWDLWIRFLEDGWGQVEVPRPLFRYRQHGISMSVTTEARFEDARLEIATSHPSLYDPERLRAIKAEWYPWVSVLVHPQADVSLLAAQELDDVEVVAVGPAAPALEELCRRRGWPMREAGSWLGSAVHSARGKFLIDWRPVADAGPGLLGELAASLEEDVDAYASAVEAGRHPTLWRRWSLLDPDAAPDRLAKAGTRGAGPALVESDYRGAFPHPRWAIDPAGFRTPVHRVRPEVEGRFPAWLP